MDGAGGVTGLLRLLDEGGGAVRGGAAAGAALTATSGRIFDTVPAETPARARSSTERYGRPVAVYSID